MAERVGSRGTAPGRLGDVGLAMKRLARLHEAGVSIWLDTLSRDLLESGAFATLVDEYAVSGATSNPTIFAKAITGSEGVQAFCDSYDQLVSCIESKLGSLIATP